MSRRVDRAIRGHGGFSLIELLIVVTILGVLASIAIPQLRDARIKAVRREGLATVEDLSLVLERRASEGNYSYTDGNGRCPGSTTYTAGQVVPDLSMAIDDSYFGYTIEASDPNGDGLCEAFRVVALGTADPVLGQTITHDQLGVKGGSLGWH